MLYGANSSLVNRPLPHCRPTPFAFHRPPCEISRASRRRPYIGVQQAQEQQAQVQQAQVQQAFVVRRQIVLFHGLLDVWPPPQRLVYQDTQISDWGGWFDCCLRQSQRLFHVVSVWLPSDVDQLILSQVGCRLGGKGTDGSRSHPELRERDLYETDGLRHWGWESESFQKWSWQNRARYDRRGAQWLTVWSPSALGS